MAGRTKKPKRKPPRGSKLPLAKTKGVDSRKTKKARNTQADFEHMPAVAAPALSAADVGEGRISRLSRAIQDVRSGARTSSRTTKLLMSGTAKMAQKVIEEAAEVGIEAIRGDRVALISESADLI